MQNHSLGLCKREGEKKVTGVEPVRWCHQELLPEPFLGVGFQGSTGLANDWPMACNALTWAHAPYLLGTYLSI